MNKKNTKLDILIASYGESGLLRLNSHTLPEIEGVRWLISSQFPHGDFPSVPVNLSREDIIIKFSKSSGLAHNRNLLLNMATAPLCLIADDDLIYTPQQIQEVITVFNTNPKISVATFMYHTIEQPDAIPSSSMLSSAFEKFYPDYSFSLDRLAKGYFVSAIEIAFRREIVMKKGIRFNENFGVNQRYACGEDSLFLHDMIASGLKGYFFPIVITTHIGLSTGNRRMGDPDILRAQGVIISRLYPKTGFLRVILKAYRSSRISEKSLTHCLRHALTGWKDYIFHKSTLFPKSIPLE